MIDLYRMKSSNFLIAKRNPQNFISKKFIRSGDANHTYFRHPPFNDTQTVKMPRGPSEIVPENNILQLQAVVNRRLAPINAVTGYHQYRYLLTLVSKSSFSEIR